VAACCLIGLPIPAIQHENPTGVGKGRLLTYFVEKLLNRGPRRRNRRCRATAAHRTEETDAPKPMIDRIEERFDLKPKRLIGDTAYGSAAMLGWLVDEKQIEPHIPVWDKTQRTDDSLSSSAFYWDEQRDEYRCPQGYALRSEWRSFSTARTHITKADTIVYRSRQSDCAVCPLKSRCRPSTPIR
jgi:hypothetical protein